MKRLNPCLSPSPSPCPCWPPSRGPCPASCSRTFAGHTCQPGGFFIMQMRDSTLPVLSKVLAAETTLPPAEKALSDDVEEAGMDRTRRASQARFGREAAFLAQKARMSMSISFFVGPWMTWFQIWISFSITVSSGAEAWERSVYDYERSTYDYERSTYDYERSIYGYERSMFGLITGYERFNWKRKKRLHKVIIKNSAMICSATNGL